MINNKIMINLKYSPADCVDQYMAQKLDCQGIGVNDYHISIEPNLVYIKNSFGQINIPMQTFRKFAEWFLEKQDIDI